MPSTTEYTTLGKPVPRIDAAEMVSGEAMYPDDLTVPGMVYGKILRSPYAHARIVRINTDQAERMPGVRLVVTGADLPDAKYTPNRPLLAQGKVYYHGQKVAAVVADDPDRARDALRAIKVVYEELPALADPLEAMKPGAPWIREPSECQEVMEDGVRLPNIAGHSVSEEGDVDRVFQEADVVVEGTYRMPGRFHQMYLEPHAAIARAEPSGRVTVWTTSQGGFRIRDSVASALGMSVGEINVIVAKVGGGFGGKNSMTVEALAVALAQRVQRPVKITTSRAEVILDAQPASGCTGTLRTCAKKDGTITGMTARVIWDGGAFGGGGGAGDVLGPYVIPNYRLEGFGVYTNKLTSGAYRAPGRPQAAILREPQIDRLARALDMDPAELRLKNLRDTTDTPDGPASTGYRETMEQAAEHLRSGRDRLGKRQGRGIACGNWTNAAGSSSAYLTLRDDGSAGLLTGSVDITGVYTALAQIISEELTIPLGKITVKLGDTDSVPYAALSAGSRTAYATGLATQIAARQAKARLFRMAAETLGVDEDALEIADERIRVRADPDTAVTIAEMVTASMRTEEGPIAGSGTVGQRTRLPALSVHIADVEVDPETGIVRLLRFRAVQDVGFALSPLALEGQMHGGATQSIGLGLMEEYQYDDRAKVLNLTLADYRIPTARDIPTIETTMVETINPYGPYGAKGAGEPPIIPAAPAIANAIYDAIGVRMDEFPITPERVLQAIHART